MPRANIISSHWPQQKQTGRGRHPPRMAPQSPLRLSLAVVQEDSARATRRLDHEGHRDGAESGGQRFHSLFRLPLPILYPFRSMHLSFGRLTHLLFPLPFLVFGFVDTQQVSEEAHIHFRDAGAIIEEALPPSPSSPSYDAYMEKEKLAARGEDVVLDEKAALAKDLELEAAEVHVDGTNGEDGEEGDGERGIADRERGGDDDDEEGDGGDGGFGDFQGGVVALETGTGAVPIPNLLDTLKGIDGQGGLSMSYDSGVTDSEQHGTEGVDGQDGRADGGEEDWLGGLR